MLGVKETRQAMSSKKRVISFVSSIEDAAVDFFNHLLQEKPQISFFIPLILIAWVVERWVFPFSTWVPIALAVWTTIQVNYLTLFPLALLSSYLHHSLSQNCSSNFYLVRMFFPDQFSFKFKCINYVCMEYGYCCWG